MEDLVQLIYDNIATVSIGNLLKLRQNFALTKDATEGNSIEEFCDMFENYCISRVEYDDPVKLGKAIELTSKFKGSLQENGRKDSKMDIYLLDLRRIFKE